MTRVRSGKFGKLQPKALTCPHCGRIFALDPCLAAHKTIEHREQAPYKCSLCKIAFFSAHAYNDHIVNHSLKKKTPASYYKCCECSLDFPTEHGLRVHISQHTGVSMRGMFTAKSAMKSRFIACSFCPAVVEGKSRYDEHLKIHKTVRPFECKQCNVFFRVESQLRNHMKRHNEFKDLPKEAVDRYFAQVPGGSRTITQEEENSAQMSS